MQSLARYSEDTPSPPAAGPSRNRNNTSPGSSSRHRIANQPSRISSSSSHLKRRRSGSPRDENLTHISQAELQRSEWAAEPVAVDEKAVEDSAEVLEGMSEEEMLRRITRPPDIEGVDDWGIPPEVDPARCDQKLTNKVAQFLDLKYSRNQHINTSLLASTSFANPHIYSKLVEFVDLSERATAFPAGGWFTRQGLEDLIPKYGPKALNDEQKRKSDEVRKSQEIGKRSTINFAPAKHKDARDGEREGVRSGARSRDDARDDDRYRKRYRDDRGRDYRENERHRTGGWAERDMRRDKRDWDRRR